MRREIPLLLTFLFGTFYVVDLWMSRFDWWGPMGSNVKDWALIIVAFTFVLGVGNVLRIHMRRIQRRDSLWGYSTVTVAGAIVMMVWGIVIPWIEGPTGLNLLGGYEGDGKVFTWLYDSFFSPMQATMFALLAFFISSAAFRAFRVRSFSAALLAVTAVIVMAGRVPLGQSIFGEWSSDFVEWIMSVLQSAGKRAILIGAALGAVSTGVKIILGIERSYLSGD